MFTCVCFRSLFRKRGYNQVHNKSVAGAPDPLPPSVELPQAMHESPKKHTSEAQLSASPPSVVRSEKKKETSGVYVFNKDKVELVQSLSNVGKSHEAPVLVSEDKIAMVRKRLASM